MKLGFSTWAMPNLPIDNSIDHLATLGYDAIEITILPGYSDGVAELDKQVRRQIATHLRERNLTLSAIMTYLSMAEEDQDAYERNFAYLRGAIDLAVDWTQEWTQDGVPPVVITGIGGKPGELEPLLPRLVERLEPLGEVAEAAGVVIALEHHINTAVETPDDVQRLMSQIKSPAIRTNFDISHFNVLGIPTTESVAEMIPWSVHTHVKDESGRAPDFEYLIPGEGEFDYVAYLQSMAAHGYDGVISVEISKMVQNRAEYDPLVAATQSYRIINQAFQEAGIPRSP